MIDESEEVIRAQEALRTFLQVNHLLADSISLGGNSNVVDASYGVRTSHIGPAPRIFAQPPFKVLIERLLISSLRLFTFHLTYYHFIISAFVFHEFVMRSALQYLPAANYHYFISIANCRKAVRY
jgi:hypothetical protein